ncbi:MAG: crossover junction endodeoxyribonuclease RuvC [Bacteroidetes bacterium]|nr:MAG: crossover junction endodeoxyribonuclease RuvC [Bacteroidota bacterium]
MAKDNNYKKIILGIDPGTNIAGYGIIGIGKNNMELISMGIFDLRKEANHAMKLQAIFEKCTQLIDTYLPDEVALEAPFMGKNPQSMLKLGRAQGVSMAAALNRNLPVFEYAPKRVKQSVTGNGNASKEQVAGMVQALLKLEKNHSKLDATDAVAVAICHHFMYKPGASTSSESYGSWKSFVSKNPDKIK